MTQRVTDSRIFLILGFSLLLSLGGGTPVMGQTQPCPGCLPPSPGIPTNQPPTYIPGIPPYLGNSSSMGPQTSPSGWTVPVPHQISISQTGQVYFHYNNAPFSGRVPVSGINPFQTFNGTNGMPHWSTMGGNLAGMISNYYGSPSNYSTAPTFSPFASQQSPIQLASVYNPNTRTQIGVTNISGFTNSLNSFGATSLTYRSPDSLTYTSSNSFTNSNFNNYYNLTKYPQQTNSSTNQLQGALRNNGLNLATIDFSGQARNLTNGGRYQFLAGQLQKALETYNRALPISQAANDKVGQAVTHASIAQTYLAMGEGGQALEHFNRAFQVSREAKDLKLQTIAMRGIGAAHLASGETELALNAYRRAHILADDEATEAEILASMGWVYQSTGELQQAVAHYQDALTLVVKSGNQAAEVKTRVGIGLLYHSLGDANKSLDQYRAALKIANSDAEVAGILISAGDVYQSNRMTKKAFYCYDNALSLMKKSCNRIGEAAALISIARMYLSMDSWLFAQDALNYYANALKLMREEVNRTGEAGALAGIGEVYFWAGLRGYPLTEPTAASAPKKALGKSEPFISIKRGPYGLMSSDFPKAMKQALRYYEEALAVMTSLGNRVGEVGILTNIGLTYDSWDKPKEALAAYLKAIDGLESLRVAARLEEFRTSLAQQATVVYQRAILLHLRLGQEEQAFELSERARARTFLDQMGNARLDIRMGADAQATAQEQALRQRLAALENQLAQEVAQPVMQLNKEAIQALEARLTAGRREYEDLLTRLKASNPEYASLISVDTLKLPQAQSLLAPDVTLVSYFVTPEMTLAFVVTRDSFHVTKLSIMERQLIAAINSFRDFSSLEEAMPPGLKQLHKWLIAPIKSRLKTPLVGIIPHGVLHSLPFASLTDGKRYLGDNYTLFYLPSVSTLRYIRPNQKTGGRLLALAYGEGEGLPFLPYTNGEAQAVATLYGMDARVGATATESALRASAGEYEILHLAAHYQLNRANPLFSHLILAPDKNADGLLELQEVYGLDLKRADLVVLSACQSQLGSHSRGDDITGLSRAFMYAGAPTVIASLWSVDDKTTVEFMTSFYTHLKEGMGKAAALRAAQSDMRTKYPHPYYWAGFVLTGYPGAMTTSNLGPAER